MSSISSPLSYLARLSSSPRTSYAAAISRNMASASSLFSTFLSGCHCRASFLYARLISDIDAVFETSKILYQSFRLLIFRDFSALINASRMLIS
uniref:DnaJ homolog subfamily C member 3 homolog n=1 Tax=Rhizophora mucronata TaxID=61149 RepID=A0A2P2M088_RHIMU